MREELNKETNFLFLPLTLPNKEILLEKIGQCFGDEERIKIYCFENWQVEKGRASPWGAFVNHFLPIDISDIYTEYKTMELTKMKHSLCIIYVMSQFSCKNTVFPQ